MDFQFEVIRLWEIPADELLRSPLATLPLAVLGKLPDALGLEDGLAEVIRRLQERLQQEADGGQAERLMTAAYILTGLRLPRREDVTQLFQGVSIAMRDSVTYQAILDEGRKEGRKKGLEKGVKKGRVDELHRTILRLGRERFGDADETIRQQVEAKTSVAELEELTVRLLRVSSWGELLS